MFVHYLSLTVCPKSVVRTSLVFLALSWAVAVAQEPPVTDTEEAVSGEPVSPSDAGDALREIERLISGFDDDEQIAALRTGLEVAQEQLGTEIEVHLNRVPLEEIDQSRLDGVLLAVSRQRASVSDLLSEINEAIADINSIQETLRQAENTWTEVLDDVDKEDLPQELIDLIGNVVDEAASGRALASARLGELVSIESDTLELSSRLASLNADAEARERALLADIFRRDSQLFWTALAGFSIDGAVADIAALADRLRYGLRDIVDTYGSRLVGQGLGGLFVFLLVVLARRNPAFKSQIEESAAQRLLEHPIALAIVLTLALTQPLYPTAQPSVVALNTAVFIAAEFIVLGAVLKGIGWRPLLLTGAYLIAMMAAYLLPYGAPLHRLVMLAGALAGVALIVATWRMGNARFGFGRWRTVVGALLLILGFLLATSVIANMLGAVTYASFVIEAAIRCYLAALGLLTLSIIVRDLVDILLATRFIRHIRSVHQNRISIALLLKKTISAVAVILWTWAALSAFRLLDALLDGIQAALNARWAIGQVSISLGTIIVFVFSVWLAVYVSRVTRFFLDEDVLPRLDLPRGVPGAISTGVHYLIISAALLFGTAAAGLDLTKLAIVVGALSVGIGFGLQNIVNNFVSGLILLFERPIQVGDHVQVGQLMGRVSRIGIRASTVRMYEGSEVIVPNGDLISQQVVNYTLSDRDRRMEVIVGVAYGTDLEKARDVIANAVSTVSLVSTKTPTQVLFHGFGESSLDFRILFWIDDFENGLVALSEVGVAVNRALKEDGIEIPFPQRDLHFRGSIPVDGPDADQPVPRGPDPAQP
jgi:small-conductance mechanosensitive channel